MKITNIETLVFVDDLMDNPKFMRNNILVKVDTDEGITGVGEATIRNRELAVKAAVDDHIAPFLIGTSPFDVSKMFDRFFTRDAWRGGAVLLSAVSGIETAMWDIIGKYAGQPVYNLLGGKFKPDVRTYANGWFFECKSSEEYVEAALKTVEAGWDALKWDPPLIFKDLPEYLMVEEAAKNVYAIREAVGRDVDLLIEIHGQLSYAGAMKFAKLLEDADVMFMEEPMPPDDKEGFQKLGLKTAIPIAGGERIFTRFGYKAIINEGVLSVAQPDLTHMGGILETKLTAAMLEAAYIKFAPHNSNGIVATAAAVMVDATGPNFLIQEMGTPVLQQNERILKSGLTWKKGRFILDDSKPGLGVEVDFDTIKKFGYKRSFTELPK
ncbi:MAG: mandelate racemase/muconate lactonizing enzyme family protein [Peptococcaceae bacterium]|jgi:galactonate dehydratase|nr:mandelate racemase/muconate lactonizing enzyme family protein [Peptococcaceae bacterium]